MVDSIVANTVDSMVDIKQTKQFALNTSTIFTKFCQQLLKLQKYLEKKSSWSQTSKGNVIKINSTK